MGIVIGDVLENTRLAKGKGNTEDEHDRGEHVDVQAHHERLWSCDGGNGEFGLWVGQQEQADPAHPEHPPSHPMRTILVAEHTPHRSQHTARQREARSQQRRHANV